MILPTGYGSCVPGEELIPIIKAGGAMAGKALDDSHERTLLQGMVADHPAMELASDKYARRVLVKQSILLRLYQPLARLVGVSREYFDSEFASDMAKKLENVPDEQITTPAPAVAVPAMQGLGYSFSERDLKEMYLNLLATATDARVRESAHPSFADIIKQLSPKEAIWLTRTLRRGSVPIVRLLRKAESGRGVTVIKNHVPQIVDVPTGEPAEEAAFAVWVDNWARLGLVRVDYTKVLTREGAYDYVEARPEYVRAIADDPRGASSVECERGIVTATDFGEQFLNAVTYGDVVDVVADDDGDSGGQGRP